MITAISTGLIMTSCSTTELRLRPLEPVISHAANEAKQAGAEKLELELTLVYAVSGGASVPTPFVPVNLTGSRSETTKLKINIDKLQSWNQRQVANLYPQSSSSEIRDTIYRLDSTGTTAIPLR